MRQKRTVMWNPKEFPDGLTRIRTIGGKKKNRPPMRQILLRESVLGHRYGELGNFSKSADLKSLFTESADESENRLMWYRLSALACQPMREIGLASLAASAGSRPAARV